MSADAAFLRIEGVSKRFGATVALEQASLEVRSGEVHALVGENGSGKSTLMRIIAGAHAPDSGTMWLGGESYQPRSPIEARRRGVAMIHQELSLCGHLSIAENVLLGVEEASFGVLHGQRMRERAGRALAALGHIDMDTTRPVQELPIGLRQLVEIARATAVGSKVLILDEPTSSLTEADAHRLFTIIEALRQEGQAIIYISHFLDEIKRISNRMTVLRDGRSVYTGDSADVPAERIVQLMVGRQIESIYPHSQRVAGDPLLEFEGLSGTVRPNEVALRVHRGEVLGIAGLNGSGRTELLRAVFGLDPIASGKVRLGVFSGGGSPAQRWRQGAGMLSEDRKEEGLALGMGIADNMTLTALERLGGWWLRPRKQEAAAKHWIEQLGIRSREADQPVGELSGGNQQKVALARMLWHDVDLLLLDEPTRGIDVGSKQLIYQLIDEAARAGKAILMVSSYLPELLGVCDRIAVMHKGRLGPARAASELSEESIMHEAVGA